MPPFDLDAYLTRIGLTRADVPVSPEGLRILQTAQLRSIPFEDIAPYLGETPDLSMSAIFGKTVHGGRGGYCFELNQLLQSALEALGFQVRRSMGRVRRATPQGGARSHLLLQVSIDGARWLADAGFGGPGALIPLEIDCDRDQPAPNGLYRLRDDPATKERVLERRGSGDSSGDWVALYAFDDAHVGDLDIEGANFLCANWDQMPFSSHLMLAGFDGDTRLGLFDLNLSEFTAQGETRRRLESYHAFSNLVRDRLHLRLEPETVASLWRRLNDS